VKSIVVTITAGNFGRRVIRVLSKSRNLPAIPRSEPNAIDCSRIHRDLAVWKVRWVNWLSEVVAHQQPGRWES